MKNGATEKHRRRLCGLNGKYGTGMHVGTMYGMRVKYECICYGKLRGYSTSHSTAETLQLQYIFLWQKSEIFSYPMLIAMKRFSVLLRCFSLRNGHQQRNIKTSPLAFKPLADPDPTVPWDTFSFGLNGVQADSMWINRIDVPPHNTNDNSTSSSSLYSTDSSICLVPGHTTISLHPAATILNYGQGIFEGLKAFRRADGTVALFRPDANAQRFSEGAKRLLMPPIPTSTFVTACDEVVRANARWIPPHSQGALYLRPLLFGSGPDLGVKASQEYTFCIFCSPVGDYFKKHGGGKPIRLQATTKYSRAAPRGAGAVKAGGNYAPCFLAQKEVRSRGYAEALFLDAVR